MVQGLVLHLINFLICNLLLKELKFDNSVIVRLKYNQNIINISKFCMDFMFISQEFNYHLSFQVNSFLSFHKSIMVNSCSK